MASPSSFLSEEQFLCSICLDVFTEPVSIPCGHNFCKACITRHWEGKEQCQCPLCNNKFNKGLKICINTAFREVVENFKKHHQETLCDNNDFLVKPGLVQCDYCLDKKVKASKTCLVCLASFCELHLEPHQRVNTLRRHQLTEPVQNLEDKICKNHNRILEHFCRTDLICICVLCTDHSAHDTVPLEKAYVNKKAQVGKKKAEQKSGKKAQKMKAPMQTKKKDKDDGASNQTQASHIWWFPTESPHEFNRYSYVPGNRCVSEAGSCYEIQLNGGTNWDLGVVTESIGGESPFLPIHGNGMGIIKLEKNSSCKALRNDPIHLYLIKKPERVFVFVDCESKLLSFYDPYLKIMSYSLTGPKFSERILLFLFPCPTECVSWVQRLRKKVQKIKAWSQRPDNLCYSIVTVCVLLLSVLLEFK